MPVNEGIFSLKNQQQIISQDVENLQRAINFIELKTKKDELHREEKDIEFKKDLQNLMMRIEKLSPKSQNPNIDENCMDSYGNKTLHDESRAVMHPQYEYEINVKSEKDKMKPKNSTSSLDSSTSRKADPKINLNAILEDKNLSKEDLMEIIASAVGKASSSTSSSNRSDEMRDVSGSENLPLGQYNKLNDSTRRDNRKSDYPSNLSTGETQAWNPKTFIEKGFRDETESGFNRNDKSHLAMTYNEKKKDDDCDVRSNPINDTKFHNNFASNSSNDRERREISSVLDPNSRPMSRSLDGSSDSTKLRDSSDAKTSKLSKFVENEKLLFSDNPRNVEKTKKSELFDQYRDVEETKDKNYGDIQHNENWYSPDSDREKTMSSNSPQRESIGHRVVFQNNSQEYSRESSGQSAEYDRLTSTDKDRVLEGTENNNDNENVSRGRYDRDDIKESERWGRGRGRDIPNRQTSSRGSKSTILSTSIPSRTSDNNRYPANSSGSTSVSPRTSPIRTKSVSGIVSKTSGILRRDSSRGDMVLSPSESDRTAALRAGRSRSIVQSSNSPIRYASNRTPDSTYSVRSTSTGGGTRLAEDPIREVLSKFLDIYQNDQNQIKSTLEKLAGPVDHRAKMSSSFLPANVPKNDQRSDFGVKNRELFDDDRDSTSTRNNAEDKDDNNNLRNRRFLAENDTEMKNAMHVGQYTSKRRTSSTEEAENLLRANELFSRYGEGEIYNYNDRNNNSRRNDDDDTTNNSRDNRIDYNDNVRKENNNEIYDNNKIINDHNNNNHNNKIINNDNNHINGNKDNQNKNNNISSQANVTDHRSNVKSVESNYRNIMNDVDYFGSKSRDGYDRNRVSDEEESEEEYQNYDNNDSTSSRLRHKKRKNLSQSRQKKTQLSLSPKRDSRPSISTIKVSSSAGRKTSNVNNEKHSFLKSGNNGCSSSLKKPIVSHWLPNKVRKMFHNRIL